MKEQSVIQKLTQEITAFCAPQQIYVFSVKVNMQDELTSFKLCVVASTADKFVLERDIYLKFDCPLPFDVVVYTTEEWARFVGQPGSFAGTIAEKGWLVYDQKA